MKKHEIWVGLFLLVSLMSMLFICLVSININSTLISEPTYRIYGIFNNIGSLKIQSPVSIGGVVIGRVANISLNEENYLPCVEIDIAKKYNRIPKNSSLSIRTSGLLGKHYLALDIGSEDQELESSVLKNGDIIYNTKSALVIEDIIGQFFFNKK